MAARGGAPPPPEVVFLEEQLTLMAENAVALEQQVAARDEVIEDLEERLASENHDVLCEMVRMRDARVEELEDALAAQEVAHRAKLTLAEQQQQTLRDEVARLALLLSQYQQQQQHTPPTRAASSSIARAAPRSHSPGQSHAPSSHRRAGRGGSAAARGATRSTSCRVGSVTPVQASAGGVGSGAVRRAGRSPSPSASRGIGGGGGGGAKHMPAAVLSTPQQTPDKQHQQHPARTPTATPGDASLTTAPATPDPSPQVVSPRLTLETLRHKHLCDVLHDAEDVLLRVEAMTGGGTPGHVDPVRGRRDEDDDAA